MWSAGCGCGCWGWAQASTVASTPTCLPPGSWRSVSCDVTRGTFPLVEAINRGLILRYGPFHWNLSHWSLYGSLIWKPVGTASPGWQGYFKHACLCHVWPARRAMQVIMLPFTWNVEEWGVRSSARVRIPSVLTIINNNLLLLNPNISGIGTDTSITYQYQYLIYSY